MEKLNVKNGLLLVEKYDKVKKDKGSNPFVLDTNNNLGIVKHKDSAILDEYLKVGDKVYFGIKNTERINIGGAEMFAMKFENIVAILEETSNAGQNQ